MPVTGLFAPAPTLGIKVDISFDQIAERDHKSHSKVHAAVGRIRYPTSDPESPKIGWLLVLKSSVTGDELARITNYHHAHADFPHQSTGDQFFDDDQFESYRELGYHIGKTVLSDAPAAAWSPSDPGFHTWWKGLYDKSSEPLDPATVQPQHE